jgi:hypothetical protein
MQPRDGNCRVSALRTDLAGQTLTWPADASGHVASGPCRQWGRGRGSHEYDVSS